MSSVRLSVCLLVSNNILGINRFEYTHRKFHPNVDWNTDTNCLSSSLSCSLFLFSLSFFVAVLDFVIIKNFSDLRVTPSFTLLACISCVLSQILLPVSYFPVTVPLLIAHVFTYRRVCLWFYMWRLLCSSVTSLVCCLPVSWIQFAIFSSIWILFGLCIFGFSNFQNKGAFSFFFLY